MQNGGILEEVAGDQQYIEITIGKKKAREKVLMGIPLGPT